MPENPRPRYYGRWLLQLVLLVLLGVGVALYLAKRNTFHEFASLKGPESTSTIIKLETPWQHFQRGESSRLAVLLTDENSAWLGIAHGLKSIGVPFLITTDVSKATEHNVVLAYPMIAGSVLDAEELALLREHVMSGKTLIGSQVLGGGLQDVFGFESVQESRDNFSVNFSADESSTQWLDHHRERTVLVGDPKDQSTWLGTQVFDNAERPLAWYESGGAALVTRSHAGGGTAYGIGLDLGFLIMRAHNDRNGEAYRDYANGYEPSVDVWLRWLKFIYEKHEPLAVTLHTVPEGRDLAAVVSLDVDYVHSVAHLPAYREMLSALNVPATFLIQTKYYRDYQDQGFFNDSTLETLNDLRRAGMEIGSHSVSHTDVFASLPIGTGGETFPEYQPRVRALGRTSGASVLGELRISKFLLEQLGGTEVLSFRPGYLAHPPSLPQALEASGYRFSSSVTAGNVTTHLPYRTNVDRMYTAQTSIYELSWFGTLKEYGEWWAARDQLEVDVTHHPDGGIKLMINPGEPTANMAIALPQGLRPLSVLPEGVSLINGLLHFEWIAERMAIQLHHQDDFEADTSQ